MYPDTVFRISVSVGTKEAGKATVTRVPCKIKRVTIETINGHRLKKAEMGFVRVWANSQNILIFNTFTTDEVEVSSLVQKLKESLDKTIKDRQVAVSALAMNISDSMDITTKDWEE